MAICPILKEECNKGKCAWWHKRGENCVIAILPALIADVSRKIADMGMGNVRIDGMGR